MVGAEQDHDAGHQLHGPLNQVQSPVVWGETHSVDEPEADQAHHQYVANNVVEILFRQPLLHVKPGLCDHVDWQTVGQTEPGEKRLFDLPLDEVGDDEGGEEQTEADAGSVVEEGVPAQLGSHHEHAEPEHCDQHCSVVDMLPLETDAVALRGLDTYARVLKWTQFELFTSPGQTTVDPLWLSGLQERHHAGDVVPDVHLVVVIAEVQLETRRWPEEWDCSWNSFITEHVEFIIVHCWNLGEFSFVL